MDKQDHLNHLKELDKCCGKGWLTFLKVEGAFYFGQGYTHDEYTLKYREECQQKGWIEEQE